MTGPDVPTLYTATEAAAILKVRQSWLERQAAARKIPFTLLGGCYRFTTAHLHDIVRIFEAGSAGHELATHAAPSEPHQRRRAGQTPAEKVAPLRPRPRTRQAA
jgi:excisionase family DNA binding protein